MKQIYCFGDSHISIFTNTSILDPGQSGGYSIFHATNMGPWLAYNLIEKGELMGPIRALPVGSTVLICFGEIDCRAQVKRQVEESERTPDEIIKEIVDRFFEVILKIKADGYEVLTFSITPEFKEQPHWYYYESNLHSFDCPRGTKEERQYYKTTFNTLVKQKSEENDIKYYSIFEFITSDEQKMASYYFDDIHLDPLKVHCFIESIFKNYIKEEPEVPQPPPDE